jgi:hypothetical protein
MPAFAMSEWKTRFAAVARATKPMTLAGWFGALEVDPGYSEAGLIPRIGFDDLTQPVWLVSAAGAVGKSTLAKQISANTGAVYLDLSQALTVGGNYLIGGLSKNGIIQGWMEGTTTLLIDALDEARLRVTQNAFNDFLADVAAMALQRPQLPIVLFGRVGVIDDAWVVLNDNGIDAPILDIQLFERQAAEDFVFSALTRLSKKNSQLSAGLSANPSAYRDVIHRVLDNLNQIAEQEISDEQNSNRRFTGYAPVLEAIATVISDVGNPAALDDAAQRLSEGRILHRLTSEVMLREKGKLAAQIVAQDQNFPIAGLYEPQEQLDRLSRLILGLPSSPPPQSLQSQHAVMYESAVASLVPQHPFLNGAGNDASNVVFGAAISAHALKSSDKTLRISAEKAASDGTHTPNPLLYDFYRESGDESDLVPLEQIGLLYDSVQAKSQFGSTPWLSVERDDEENLLATISLIDPNGSDDTVIRLRDGEPLRLGRRVSNVFIDDETLSVHAGLEGQLELVAPVRVRCGLLELDARTLVVKGLPTASKEDSVVLLEADRLVMNEAQPPLVKGVDFRVQWPGSAAYPWTNYSFDGAADETATNAEALRALRRLVLSFRSHSKGALKRFKGKIEHSRMTKGRVGEALREKLLHDGVLKIDGTMYVLDADKLGSIVGLSFLDAKLKTYSERVLMYTQDVH